MTEEPTEASYGRNNSRDTMKDRFSRESLNGGTCGRETNVWGWGCKTEGSVYVGDGKR